MKQCSVTTMSDCLYLYKVPICGGFISRGCGSENHSHVLNATRLFCTTATIDQSLISLSPGAGGNRPLSADQHSIDSESGPIKA